MLLKEKEKKNCARQQQGPNTDGTICKFCEIHQNISFNVYLSHPIDPTPPQFLAIRIFVKGR